MIRKEAFHFIISNIDFHESSNETHLAEEAVTKRNAGPALPNLPIKSDQERVDIKIQFARNFYGEDREILMFVGKSLHWRETLPRKIRFDKAILSEAIEESAAASKLKATASFREYTQPETAMRWEDHSFLQLSRFV